MKPTVVALSILVLFGSVPAAAQEHQHGAPPDAKAEAVAPPAAKSPLTKSPMSEKMTAMKSKMAERMKVKESAGPAEMGMMKGAAPKESSAKEEKNSPARRSLVL